MIDKRAIHYALFSVGIFVLVVFFLARADGPSNLSQTGNSVVTPSLAFEPKARRSVNDSSQEGPKAAPKTPKALAEKGTSPEMPIVTTWSKIKELFE